MITTKDQELAALETIKQIIDQLGEGSYLSSAFDGCFEIAEDNIRNDFASSPGEIISNLKKELAMSENLAMEYRNQIEVLEKEKAKLQERLDRELQWKPYTDSTYDEARYLSLVKSGRPWKEDEVISWLCDDYGFDRNRITIIRTIPLYEKNKYYQVREVGTSDRSPYYASSDWNYCRFKVGCMEYELADDNLKIL